ncbi:MAG TPA: M28 family peptidase [Phaeodactylibacter sp.]|nr:M28 family peptidase [Phaeodactylibacter sp.]
MKRYFSKILFLILLVIGVATCKNDKPKNDKEMLVPQKNIKVRIPKFDGEAAKAFVAKQVSFGTRVTGSEGHQACKKWLVTTFKSFGAEVIEQNFEATTFNGVQLHATNIIIRFNPKVKERILLGAHWDTRPFADQDPDPLKQSDPILGADDAGSGVGVLLEIAQLLKNNPIPMGVDMVLFDAEDYGDSEGNNINSWGLGSQYWAKNPHLKKQDVKYGILLDMVGAKDAKFSKEGYSAENAPTPTRNIWKLAKAIKKDKYFVDEAGGFVTDDHFFVMKYFGMPMVDIINRPSENFGFGKHWHTHADNMDIIDAETLAAVGQVVTAIVFKESNKEL